MEVNKKYYLIMELSNLLRVCSSLQSVTLWLVSKHDTFQNHVDVQAELEAAAPPRARRPHRAGAGHLLPRVARAQRTGAADGKPRRSACHLVVTTSAGDVREDA